MTENANEMVDEYRIGRAKAMRTLWREYRRLVRHARRSGYSLYLTIDAQHVKREIDRLMAERD